MCIWIVGGRVPVTGMLAGMNLSKPGMNLSKPGLNLSKPGKKHNNHVIIHNISHNTEVIIVDNYLDSEQNTPISPSDQTLLGVYWRNDNHSTYFRFWPHWILLVTPCLLPRIREFIHTQHHNTTLGLRPRVVLRCCVWINSRIRGSKQGVTNLSHAQTIFMTFWTVFAALKSQPSH